MIEYELGQSIRMSAAFLNASGAAANPTTTQFKFALQADNPPPDPTATTLTFGVDAAVIQDSTGNFHADIVPSLPGDYVYMAIGTGAVAAAARGKFRVLPSPFA